MVQAEKATVLVSAQVVYKCPPTALPSRQPEVVSGMVMKYQLLLILSEVWDVRKALHFLLF